MSLLLMAAAAAADAVAPPSQFPWMLVNGLPNDVDVKMK